MNLPLISVVITVFNAEKYLFETLNSVLNQTYSNLEIIVVNDGSTDNSLQIIEEICKTDKRIKTFTIINLGQSAASNYGISKSKGEYIKFIDADDIFSENHIEFQYNAIKNYPNYLASCEWGRFYGDDYSKAEFKPEKVWKDMNSLEWIKNALSQKNDMMPAWLWLIPRRILVKAGLWNEELSLNNDFDFSIRLLLASEGVKFAKDAKLFYRSGLLDNLSNVFNDKSLNSAFLTTQSGCDNILKIENTEFTRQLCANRFQTWAIRLYPNFIEFSRKFEKKAKEIGKVNLKLEGSFLLKLLELFLGWKIALRIKSFFYSIGYKSFKKSE